MTNKITSDTRNYSLKTALGQDVLFVSSFSGKEEISRLFSYTLELESTDPAINFDSIVGTKVTLSILLPDTTKRFINAYVSRFVQTSQQTDLSHYHMELVPWLWLLTRTSDCKIFQNKSIPDIIAEVFDENGFSGQYEFKLGSKNPYTPWEYCVQYRETDFNFVSRLMEEQGIFYYFTHADGEHKLILGDAAASHKKIEPAGDVEYSRSAEEVSSRPCVSHFTCEQSVRPTALSLKDFDFKKPSTNLLVSEAAESKFEIYDYPGNYGERKQGEVYAKIRLEQERATKKIFTGSATDRRLTSGCTFNLTEHPRKDFNTTYLITSVYHHGSQMESDATYECSFECIASAIPFRPQQITPKPIISGVQTAVVTGPSGEEIWLDKNGRVLVQFHWDRLGKYDEKSSCWIRVSHGWAGKNWGIVFHPRIGQEVIVQFEEGDPDKPIITGRVYNQEHMPPYELPANGTQSTIKSRSSKGGEPDNFNEIRFEDKKGEEEVFLHAEKNLNTVVKANETRSVGGTRTTTIAKEDKVTVKEQDSLLNVSNGNRKVDVKSGNYELTTTNKAKTTANQGVEVTGKQNGVKIDGEPNIIIHGTSKVTINSPLIKIENHIVHIDGDSEIVLHVGAASITVKNDSITMGVGPSSITIKPDGIQSSGPNINATATGKHEISGALIKLN